jgi:hypothetical protein
VPLKKSRGKFIKPWESPDEMELDEVTVSLLSFVVLIADSQHFVQVSAMVCLEN